MARAPFVMPRNRARFQPQVTIKHPNAAYDDIRHQLEQISA